MTELALRRYWRRPDTAVHWTEMAYDLVQARACYDRGAWDEAFEGLRLADEAAPLSCDDLQRLGFAAYLIGGEVEFERCFDLGAWDEAFEGLRLADEAAPLSCDDLQRLGFAAYLIGGEVEFERCFDR